MNNNLFTYGVLMYEELTELLTGKSFTSVPATLRNHQRLALHKEGWPEIAVVVEKEYISVKGNVLMGVDRESLQIIDDFEEVESDLYRRMRSLATLDSGEKVAVDVYLGGSLTDGYLSGEWIESAFVNKYYHEYKERIIPFFLNTRK